MRIEALIPYIWATTGLVTLIGIVFAIQWAYAHHQFDENIKDQIFSDGDDDRYKGGR